MLDPKTNSQTQMIAEINALLADHFALYIKTKNFHWHVKGPRFRDLHLMFDEQAVAIQGEIDAIGERARKLGGDTITSVGAIAKGTQVAEKETAEAAGDNATDGLLDDWTDMAEERVWFLNSLLS